MTHCTLHGFLLFYQCRKCILPNQPQHSIQHLCQLLVLFQLVLQFPDNLLTPVPPLLQCICYFQVARLAQLCGCVVFTLSSCLRSCSNAATDALAHPSTAPPRASFPRPRPRERSRRKDRRNEKARNCSIQTGRAPHRGRERGSDADCSAGRFSASAAAAMGGIACAVRKLPAGAAAGANREAPGAQRARTARLQGAPALRRSGAGRRCSARCAGANAAAPRWKVHCSARVRRVRPRAARRRTHRVLQSADRAARPRLRAAAFCRRCQPA